MLYSNQMKTFDPADGLPRTTIFCTMVGGHMRSRIKFGKDGVL